ncbi:MAG: F0F1 ATP synthase subunit gamma [Magnetococcales bacterium]|nr:F0F1 ATP synthase subunit gamma [Magnetococcales bacterium]
MPNLKSLRNRIRSVGNTRQITKAMKMVAAAKLRRSQERAQATRPYSRGMGLMIQSIASMANEDSAPPLLAAPKGKRVCIAIFTADRGLCGSFNSGVIRSVRSRVVALQNQGMDVSLVCIGTKGRDVLKRQFGDLIKRTHIGIAKDLNYEKAEREVSSKLLVEFEKGEFDVCMMVYNEFKSAISQELTWRQIIPMPVDEVKKEDDDEEGYPAGAPYYEPDEADVLNVLLPQNVTVQVFQALVESDASEHGSRMTAMDNAVRNAGDMLNKLNITYNRTRQAVITTELMEIISGSESLKG